jgi:hypothetical protein
LVTKTQRHKIRNSGTSFKGHLKTGLPDFSWYNIPKRGKNYKITTKLPTLCPYTNGRNTYIPNDQNIFHSNVLQSIPKLGLFVWKETIWQSCSKTWTFIHSVHVTSDYFGTQISKLVKQLFKVFLTTMYIDSQP